MGEGEGDAKQWLEAEMDVDWDMDTKHEATGGGEGGRWSDHA